MQMDTPLRIAVDFDGVLHDPSNVQKGYKLGSTIPGSVAAMQKLKEEGAILVIHSVWADTEQKCQAMAKWCQYFKIPYDFISNQKPICDFYIDDHGLRFESWPQALADIKRLHN